jgi:hypothetical protein
MTVILAIDPGTVQSAWLAFDTTAGLPLGPWRRTFGEEVCPALRAIEPNGELIDRIRGWHAAARFGEVPYIDAVVIEQVVSYGMPIGETTIETVHWAGRFAEAAFPLPVYRVPRLAVRMALCHSGRAKDPNVRAALLDRFGRAAAIGRKAHPGPLYGFKADLFAALGVAVTWADMLPDDRAAARLP